jgi:gluconate 2-dehydrogenase alpha chain
MKQLKPVDAVIVGGGWTGLTMAKELTSRTSLSVVVLERGGPASDYQTDMDEIDHFVRKNVMMDPTKETVTFRHTMTDRALPLRRRGNFDWGFTLGGSGEHWAGASYRFLPESFQILSRTIEKYGPKRVPDDHSIHDWPMTYGELEPYYVRAERMMGISGKAGNLQGRIIEGGNVLEGPRSAEYPNPPKKQAYAGKLFLDATKSLGYHPYPTPSATLSQTYTNPDGVTRGPCTFCGFCDPYGCMIGAKAQPSNTLVPALKRLKNCEIRTSSWVRRIQVKNGRAVGVQYTNDRGEDVFQPAELVVLAAFAMDNTRLLLLSGIGEPYDPKTGKGALGANYTVGSGTTVTLFFEQPMNHFMGAGGTGMTISDFDGDLFDHSQLSFIRGGIMTASSRGSRPIGGDFGNLPERVHSRWGSEWKKQCLYYFDRTGHVSFAGEHLAYRGNYLDLDPVYKDNYGDPLLRITLDWRDNERRMTEFAAQKAAEIGRAMGAKEVRLPNDRKQFDARNALGGHSNGGTIMGASPADSVLNKYGQHWQTSNLFVLGGSSFPQRAAPNPTVTIVAVAYHSADAIIDRYLKRPGTLA